MKQNNPKNNHKPICRYLAQTKTDTLCIRKGSHKDDDPTCMPKPYINILPFFSQTTTAIASIVNIYELVRAQSRFCLGG